MCQWMCGVVGAADASACGGGAQLHAVGAQSEQSARLAAAAEAQRPYPRHSWTTGLLAL